MTVLLIRFSALGDVALLSPVVYCALAQNPELQLQILTRKNFESLFPAHPRLKFIGVDIKNEHRGLKGIFKMRSQIMSDSPDRVIDEHDVLRSIILRKLLYAGGYKISVFPKGRKEKQSLVHNAEKNNVPLLMHTTERYATPLRSLGLNVSIEQQYLPSYGTKTAAIESFIETLPEDCPKIGVAPLAKHASKIWGLQRIQECMQLIWEQEPKTNFYIFGSADERISLQSLMQNKEKTHLLAGEFTLAEELSLMGHMDSMLCMDSANMHLSTLVGVPVVSVWGGTHPNLGFSPLFNEINIIQAQLACRPATIYGKVSQKWQHNCYQKAFEMISPALVAKKLLESAQK